jgi:hypothetical protein
LVTGMRYTTKRCMPAKVMPMRNCRICMVVRVRLTRCGTLIERAERV